MNLIISCIHDTMHVVKVYVTIACYSDILYKVHDIEKLGVGCCMFGYHGMQCEKVGVNLVHVTCMLLALTCMFTQI